MINYVNENSKKFVNRNNGFCKKPPALEYDIIEKLEFQFINDNNQVISLGELSGLALAVGMKTGQPSYSLLALSKDYSISGNVLSFNLNTYTVNWLNQVRKPATEAFIEISQNSLEDKKVLLRDYCYVFPRTYVEGLAPEEIASNDYYTKTEVDELIDGIEIPTKLSQLENDEGFITEAALSGKQDKITAESKLSYSLLSGTPAIPTKTSDLDNDSGFITEAALSGKQDKITSDNKLAYALLSGTPTIPTKTSDLNNDSGYITANDVPVKDVKVNNISVLSNGVANISKASTSSLGVISTNPAGGANANENGELYLVRATPEDVTARASAYKPLTPSTLNHSVTAALTDSNHITLSTAQKATAQSVLGIDTALSGKQDLITSSAKLDYALISGAPTIPTKTSDLNNDSGFITASDVTPLISGKLDKSAYIPPYRLPMSSGGNNWLSDDVVTWDDTDIIANERKVVVINSQSDTTLNFPTLSSAIDANEVRTVEVWVGMVNASSPITTIYAPSTYSVVGDMPTTLSSDDNKNTYHIFVMRFIPSSSDTYVELSYSHAWVTSYFFWG